MPAALDKIDRIFLGLRIPLSIGGRTDCVLSELLFFVL